VEGFGESVAGSFAFSGLVHMPVSNAPMDQTDRPGPPRRSEPEEAIEALEELDRKLPIWGPELVVAIAIALDLALPQKLTIGPNWLLPSTEALLLLGLMMSSPTRRVRHSPTRRKVAIALIAIVSATNIVSLALLCHFLLRGGQHNGRALIGSGLLLYATNVLLFGLWYWELDSGGPLARMRKRHHGAPDFLFVQMSDPRWAPKGWLPGLFDYLYVSLTNATAFSPTDTMPLTQTAKMLMSAQAVTALVTVGLVVARAVNILS
jgi:uncharacterized membrane protein